MTGALLALWLAASADGPVARLDVQGDLRVEVVVGPRRGVEVRGEGIEVVGPKDGVLQLRALARGDTPRPTARVYVEGPALHVVAGRGVVVKVSGERLEALTLDVTHTSRVDSDAVAVRNLTVTASEAARVRARGDVVVVTATRSAQVILLSRPKKLTQNVRDAARVTVP